MLHNNWMSSKWCFRTIDCGRWDGGWPRGKKLRPSGYSGMRGVRVCVNGLQRNIRRFQFQRCIQGLQGASEGISDGFEQFYRCVGGFRYLWLTFRGRLRDIEGYSDGLQKDFKKASRAVSREFQRVSDELLEVSEAFNGVLFWNSLETLSWNSWSLLARTAA